MNIFIVADGYPTEKYRGVGIFEFDQARALASRGHEVVYLAVNLRSIRRWRKWGFETLVRDNVKINAVNIPLGRFPKKILHFFGIIGLSLLYKKTIKKLGSPDIIHAHFTEPAYISLKALFRTNVPIVMTEHSSRINREQIDPKDKRIATYVYTHGDAVFAVSPTLQNRIKQNFGVDAKYIPNIVDLEAFKNEGIYKQSELFSVVSVGNLIPLKRMDVLIDGFAEFVKQYPKSKLIIFGEGPERTQLEKQIYVLGLAEKVKLMGSCKRSEIANALHLADCFVLVSSSETFGVVYIEALACGVPVIATTCGGPEGFVHEENGLLIPVDDKATLVDALTHMYKNSDNYDREMISKEISDKFSPDVIATELENTYKEILVRKVSCKRQTI